MTTQYFLVAIDHDVPPPEQQRGKTGEILCRELYLQFGGDRARVWKLSDNPTKVDLEGWMRQFPPIHYDPVIADGNPPPGYVERKDEAVLVDMSTPVTVSLPRPTDGSVVEIKHIANRGKEWGLKTTDVPGLFDLQIGEESWTDLTKGQVETLLRQSDIKVEE